MPLLTNVNSNRIANKGKTSQAPEVRSLSQVVLLTSNAQIRPSNINTHAYRMSYEYSLSKNHHNNILHMVVCVTTTRKKYVPEKCSLFTGFCATRNG